MGEKIKFSQHRKTSENKAFKSSLKKSMSNDDFIDTAEAKELAAKYKKIKEVKIKGEKQILAITKEELQSLASGLKIAKNSSLRKTLNALLKKGKGAIEEENKTEQKQEIELEKNQEQKVIVDGDDRKDNKVIDSVDGRDKVISKEQIAINEKNIDSVLKSVVSPKTKTEIKEDIKSGIQSKINKLKIYYKIVKQAQFPEESKEIEFSEDEIPLKREIEKGITESGVDIKEVDIKELLSSIKSLEGQLSPREKQEQKISELKDKTSLLSSPISNTGLEKKEKNVFIDRLKDFKKFLGKKDFHKMEEHIEDVINKLNDKGSKYGKGFEALDKALTNIEKVIEGDMDFTDLVDLLFDSNSTIFSDIKGALGELLSDSVDFVIAFLEDLSIFVLGLKEVGDHRDGLVVEKAKKVRGEYNTGISFIDDTKNIGVEAVIGQCAIFRGAETAIFESISGLTKIDLGEIIKGIIDVIPNIIDIIGGEIKNILKTVGKLTKEDVAFIVGYIGALILFPVKNFAKYLKGGLFKIINKVSSGKVKNIAKILEKIGKIKDISKPKFPKSIDKMKDKLERAMTIAHNANNQVSNTANV